jgi:hypothetical protein
MPTSVLAFMSVASVSASALACTIMAAIARRGAGTIIITTGIAAAGRRLGNSNCAMVLVRKIFADAASALFLLYILVCAA